MAETENVTDSNISVSIGKNIRLFRKIANLTLSELADRYLEKTGIVISGAAIGAWERGEKNISAAQLHYIAECLGVPEQSLYNLGGYQTETGEEFTKMMRFSIDWKGNKRALVQFVMLYMSIDRKFRSDIAGMGIMIYKKALAENRLEPNAIPLDIEFLESEWEKLIK